MASVSREATEILGTIMGWPPQRRWPLYREMDRRDTLELVTAAEAQMGASYGMFCDDPVGFVEVVMGETLWPTQVAIARSVEDHLRTAVPSCADAGKSMAASRLVLWWGSVWPVGAAKVVTTATKDRQVTKELWPHIRFGHDRARLAGRCLTKEWQVGERSYPVAYGYSPADTDETAFSGIHATYLLVIVDEAGGISPTLGRSLEGMLTHGDDATAVGKVRLLLIGNPGFDENATPWFEERCQSASYNVIPIPASATPNFTGQSTPLCRIHPDLPEHPISDHLVSPRWVRELADDYGTDDPYYIARVDAQFPKDLANKVIPRSVVDAALLPSDPTPEPQTGPDVRVDLGVDPAAGGGDELAVARLEGNVCRVVFHDRLSPAVAPADVAGLVLTQIVDALEYRNRIGSTRRVRVKVENDGGIGWSVAGTLKAWGQEGRYPADQVQIVAVTVGSAPDTAKGREDHHNKRAEMWWQGRAAFTPAKVEHPESGELIDGEPSVWLDVDETTVRQLSAPNQKWATSGKRLIESKQDMKARGVSSPDRADAVLLAVYQPSPAGRATMGRYQGTVPPMGGTGGGWTN